MNPTDTTQALNRSIGRLFEQALKVSGPLQQLHQIREKMNQRGYQNFDRGDILDGLGRMQGILGELHRQMLDIDNLLKKEGL